jgi:hypothetical protein
MNHREGAARGTPRPAWPAWLVRLALVGYAVALIGEARRLSITIDEPKELAESYLYWLGVQGLRPGDGPPLMRIACGWVPRLLGVPVPYGTPAWEDRNSFAIGRQMLIDAGPQRGPRIYFYTRLAMGVFPLLTIWLLWRWARQLFGEAIGGLLAAALAAEPTFLGHGALIKSDVSAAFGAVLFFFQAWRYWTRPGRWRAAGLIASLVVAVLAKFHLASLIVVAVGIFLYKGPRRAGPAAVLGAVYLGMLAAYQFDLQPAPERLLRYIDQFPWSPIRKAAARAVVTHLPLPNDYVRGLGWLLLLHARGTPSYLLGEAETGSYWYFPVAWAVKFPVGLQVLALAGVVVTARRLWRRRAGAAELFLCLPPALILAPALVSSLHLGFRHVLPALPFVVLWVGFALQALASRRPARLLAAGCLLWAVLSSARVYPNGISFFNEWAGGAEGGWRYLADSNLDWGQNLPQLARYVAQQDIERLQLYYWGIDIPSYYIPADRLEVRPPPLPEIAPTLPTRLDPQPGVYAISVNLLVGLGLPPAHRDYFAWFRERAPDARAGYSILIYQVR